MKKALILAIIAIFICSSVWAGKTIMNAPGGKRTSAQLTNTMAFPLDSGTSDYWTDLAEHYAWVKAQMDVLYASKPWYDGAAITGSVIKFYGPTVANGGHGTYTSIQGADYVGDEGTGIQWRLPITYPVTGVTGIIKTDDVGNMSVTSVAGNSKYLGTDAGGTYGIFDLPSGGSMTWPSAGGIPLYSGSSSWGTSLSSSTALHYLRRNATNDGYEFGTLPSFLASADIDTSSELRAILSDESGTGALIFADGALGTPSFTAFNMPSNDASPSTTPGQMRHDTVTTGLTGGAVAWWNGSAVKYLVDLDTLPTNDDYVVAYDADADKFYMKADDTGASHNAVTLSSDLGTNLLGLNSQELTIDSQNINTVFAGPSTGSAGAPTFRSLVEADLPALGPIFAAATSKTTPVDADEIPLSNSQSSGALNALSWANIKATLKTYFDGLYAGLYSAQDNITWGTSSGGSQTWTWDTGSGTDPSMTVADDSFTFGKKLVTPGFETNAADGTHHMNVDNSASYSGTTQGDIYSIAGVPYVYRTEARQIWDAASVPYPAQGTSATPTAGRITKWDASGRVLVDGPAIGATSGTIAAGDHTHTQKIAVFSFSGGGSDIPDGTVIDSYVPTAATITGWIITATDATACSCVVDIWRDDYANFPPTVDDTIIQSEKPTLSSAKFNKDTTISGTWTEVVTADSFLRANIDSNTCTGTVVVTLFGTM